MKTEAPGGLEAAPWIFWCFGDMFMFLVALKELDVFFEEVV